MDKAIHILIADDNKAVHDTIGLYLKAEGYTYDSAMDGAEALLLFHRNQYDFIIMDIMMPNVFGTDVLKEIRRTSNIPLMLLTAKADEFDRINGLEIGADDYVVKPFSPREVLLRMNKILNRTSTPEKSEAQVLQIGNLEISIDGYKVFVAGQDLQLTPKEFELLKFLAEHVNKVLTRENLLTRVWGYQYIGDTRAVDTHINRIRKKLATTACEGWSLVSVYGIGYKLETIDE